MAPLPPESTPRFRVHYTVNSQQHAFQIRSHESPSTIGTFIEAFLGAGAALFYSSVIDAVDFAADNSNVFNPVVTGAELFTWGTGAGSTANIPSYVNFIGRTALGRRVRLAVFGLGVGADDYRFIGGESIAADSMRQELVDFGAGIRGIDDATPVWKTYINAGVNAYWQRNVRP